VTGPNPTDDEGARGDERCAECGTRLAPSQRYCIECGARRGPLPARVNERIAQLQERGRPKPASAKLAGVAPATAAAAAADEDDDGFWSFMIIGAVTSPLASSAGFAPTVLVFTGGGDAPPPAEEEEPVEVAETPVPGVPATVAITPEAPVEVPEVEPEPEPTPPPELPPEPEEEETLPEVKHVFLIVLGEAAYEDSFGKASTSEYFAKKLPEQGELLSNYFAVAQGGLANQIALLSGQGPTPQTATNCPEYTPIVPGTLSAEKQVEGNGCVYPKETPNLPAQLVEKKLSWKAYVEQELNGAAAGEPATCRQTWRNPFVYFAEITETPECAERDVGLEQLETDLKEAKTTPTLSYIVPNACHDGAETPCAPEQLAGLAGAQAFLEGVLPKITESPAYKEEGGLIAITFAQAPQTGEKADASSCCATPEYPNLPKPTTPPEAPTGPVKTTGGGGHVGLLLLSPFVKPGTVNESGYYNHYSLLLSIEELLALEPLGYATNPALTAFESEIFNAGEEEESTLAKRPGTGAAKKRPQTVGSSSSANCRDCASRTPSALQSSPSSSKKPWRARPERKATR
jgi:hypothetical protein